jgi:hypothetical protein
MDYFELILLVAAIVIPIGVYLSVDPDAPRDENPNYYIDHDGDVMLF